MRFISTCACEKVIVDKGGAHTLISVMSGVELVITPPKGASATDLPLNALAPREWWLFSMWEPNTEEEGKDFEQVYEVYWPSGEKLLDSKTKFKADDRVQYISFPILGFPVGQQGKVKVLTWVESEGRRITDPFAYHITVKYIPEAQYPPGTPHSLAVVSVQK